MSQYTITLTLDADTDTPEEAARCFQEYVQDGHTYCVTVTDTSGKAVEIDLADLDSEA